MRGVKGFIPKWSTPAVGVFAVVILSSSNLYGAAPVRFSGMLSGLVADNAGHPQVGAVVMLFNRQDRLLQRSSTDTSGNFSFEDLLPDSYAVRITLASFVPAMKDRVQVRAGMRSLLEVNLSRVFSSVQLVSTTPAPGGLMNDDWKWTLRSNPSLRPILRYLPVAPGTAVPDTEENPERSSVFSESRGLVRISASDGAQTISNTGEADLGTQFAFATSLYGGNHLQFSGNVGYGSTSGSPAAAIRTTFSRDIQGASPAISVTMRQLFIPTRTGLATLGSSPTDTALPALRTLAVSFSDKAQLTDSLSADYGFELDTVSFIDRLHYFSPYARLSYALPRGKVDFTWSSGNARPELGIGASDRNGDLQRDLAALAMLPRVTLEGGHAKVQRGDDYELGFSQKFGSREYRVSTYRENVVNTTLTIANPGAGLFAGDLVPDLFSNSALFNAGRFETLGYLLSVAQDLGDNYKVTATYGSIGVMAPRDGAAPIETPDDLRQTIKAEHRPAIALQASGTVKHAGTRFVASYQWTDYRSALPGPQFSTMASRPEPGLNVMIRQPMPVIPGLPGRLEASAELRNLLAQGYLPLSMTNGRQLLLVNTPRSIRGGLAFVF
jgi:hypothetical protein